MVVMVDFDGAVAAGVGGRRGFDDDGFPGLLAISKFLDFRSST